MTIIVPEIAGVEPRPTLKQLLRYPMFSAQACAPVAASNTKKLLEGLAALLPTNTLPPDTLGPPEGGVPLEPMLTCQLWANWPTLPALMVVSSGLKLVRL